MIQVLRNSEEYRAIKPGPLILKSGEIFIAAFMLYLCELSSALFMGLMHILPGMKTSAPLKDLKKLLSNPAFDQMLIWTIATNRGSLWWST